VHVLMLGMNAASQMSITVRALRRIGIDAEGIVADASPITSVDGLRNLAHGLPRMQRLRRGYLRTSWSYNVASAIVRADVIHWNYGEPALGNALDIKFANILRRAGVVEFWGSDIRISEVAEQNNKYYTEARRAGRYEYTRHETKEGSYYRQELFGHNGIRVCLAPPWFDRYIEPGLFAEVRQSFARLLLDDFSLRLPQRENRPIVAHAPSARGAKGTEAVIRTVERLRAKHEFEFVLLNGLPRHEVLDAVRDCDVFLDQFVLGEYGMASLEAMAFGKAVVCYLRPDVVARSPGRIPIVNATEEDLCDRLDELLTDASLRRRVGAESRRYIELHHDALDHARSLAQLYERLIKGRR
jgi:hypothetical protein